MPSDASSSSERLQARSGGASVVLHLSDLHFGTDHDPVLSSVDALATIVAKDLRELRLSPDCVVVSGDLTTQCQPAGLAAAREFMDDLRQKLPQGLDRTAFLVVPGNHEINWTKIKAASDLGHPAKRIREDGFSDYRGFFAEFYGRVDDDLFTRSWSDGRTFVLGLNSCVVDGPDHPGVGYVAPEQLERARAKWEDDWKRCVARIAVLHHHLLPVTWTGTSTEAQDTSLTVNARRVMNWLSENGFQIALHGHQHQPFVAAETRRVLGQASNGPYAVTVMGGGSAGTHGERLGPIRRRHHRVLVVQRDSVRVFERVQDADQSHQFSDHGTYEISLGEVAAPNLPRGFPRGMRLVSPGVHWGTTRHLERLLVSYLRQARVLRCYSPTLRALVTQYVEPHLREFLSKPDTTLDATINTEVVATGYPWNDQATYESNRAALCRAVLSSRERAGLHETPVPMTYSLYVFDEDVYVYVPFPVHTESRQLGLIQVLVVQRGASNQPRTWWELLSKERGFLEAARKEVSC